MICYIAKALFTCNGGRRSAFVGNSAQLPSDVIDFAMLPAQRFLAGNMSCDLEVTNESAIELLGKKFQLYNKRCFRVLNFLSSAKISSCRIIYLSYRSHSGQIRTRLPCKNVVIMMVLNKSKSLRTFYSK